MIDYDTNEILTPDLCEPMTQLNLFGYSWPQKKARYVGGQTFKIVVRNGGRTQWFLSLGNHHSICYTRSLLMNYEPPEF